MPLVVCDGDVVYLASLGNRRDRLSFAEISEMSRTGLFTMSIKYGVEFI